MQKDLEPRETSHPGVGRGMGGSPEDFLFELLLSEEKLFTRRNAEKGHWVWGSCRARGKAQKHTRTFSVEKSRLAEPVGAKGTSGFLTSLMGFPSPRPESSPVPPPPSSSTNSIMVFTGQRASACPAEVWGTALKRLWGNLKEDKATAVQGPEL